MAFAAGLVCGVGLTLAALALAIRAGFRAVLNGPRTPKRRAR